MDALKAIETRKSVRGYTEKKVEQDKLETLAKAGTRAPKFGNFHISVITSPELLKEIDEKALANMRAMGGFAKQRADLEGYHALYGAPALFLISGPESPYSGVNAACAAANITVAATALDLASCYVGSAAVAFKDNPPLAKKAGLPEGFSPLCGVLVGYAGEDKFSQAPAFSVTVGYIQ
ncbi:nitroreductase family protein [Treponema primitia]|uniref:nitroreductase family protein n=1 Tax=Treponema primitia TaxID=88058 RepID=UPI0002555386|nr:nitroreductase family protein [Treponema primitia]